VPGAGGGGAPGAEGREGRERLRKEQWRYGSSRLRRESKIVGGGAVMGGMGSINVGERNTQFVSNYRQTERIPVVSRDVLEIYPRKVCFLPAWGKAMVKRLAATHSATSVEQDRLAQQRTAPPAAGGQLDPL